MNFKKWIDDTFDGDTLKQRVGAAADYFGCSMATAYRLYYGNFRGNVDMYERVARMYKRAT